MGRRVHHGLAEAAQAAQRRPGPEAVEIGERDDGGRGGAAARRRRAGAGAVAVAVAERHRGGEVGGLQAHWSRPALLVVVLLVVVVRMVLRRVGDLTHVPDGGGSPGGRAPPTAKGATHGGVGIGRGRRAPSAAEPEGADGGGAGGEGLSLRMLLL